MRLGDKPQAVLKVMSMTYYLNFQKVQTTAIFDDIKEALLDKVAVFIV